MIKKLEAKKFADAYSTFFTLSLMMVPCLHKEYKEEGENKKGVMT